MRYEGITPEQQEQLVHIFKTCPLCVIRDTLIDAGVVTEDFPVLYHGFSNGRMVVSAMKAIR